MYKKGMAVFRGVTPHSIGQMASRAVHTIGRLDRGIRTAGRVFRSVKEHVPEGKIQRAAERGISSNEAVREQVRQGAEMP